MCKCNHREYIVRGFLTYFILHALVHIVSAIPVIQLFIPHMHVGLVDVAAQTIIINVITHIMLVSFIVYKEKHELEKGKFEL